jgi:RHS repeat-associated protein
MTNDGRYTYTYNAENQISTANGTTFVYDGDGERVQKSDGTTYWGGGSSGALVESDNSGNAKAEYIFFNGKRIARRDLPGGSIKYYFADHLGSATVIADTSGNALERYDYAPFGELHWTSGSDTNHYLFTGKERDTETGLDYFGARYYENNFGRWLSPDWAAKPTAVPYANYGNPQSLNLYAYVVNRPTTTADPDGHASSEPKLFWRSALGGGADVEQGYGCDGALCDPEAVAEAQGRARIYASHENQKAQQKTQSTDVSNGWLGGLGKALGKIGSWLKSAKTIKDNVYDAKTLAAEQDADTQIFNMASKVVNQTDSYSLNSFPQAIEIYQLEDQNLKLDTGRQIGKIMGGVPAPPGESEFGAKVFSFYGDLRNANNQRIDQLLGEAAAALQKQNSN